MYAGYGFQPGGKRGRRPLFDPLQDVGARHTAEFALQHLDGAAHAEPQQQAPHGCRIDIEAVFVQHLGLDLAGDPLAVDQNTVTIEDHQIGLTGRDGKMGQAQDRLTAEGDF